MRRVRSAVLLLAALAALPAAASARERVRGDGRPTTVTRDVGEFDAIRLSAPLDLRVTIGPARAVRVTIDGNLQPEIETRVEDRTLVVEIRRSLELRGSGKVEVALPALSAVALEGSGDAVVSGDAGDLRLATLGSGELRWDGTARRLSVDVTGSGDLRLAGKAERLELAVAGSGDVRARDLLARDAEVSVLGSGDVELTMGGGALRAALLGSGDLSWAGEAKVERSVVLGSGEIAHR